MVSLDAGGSLVRPGLDQDCAHGSPRSCSLSLTGSASFLRKRCFQRSSHSRRHPSARKVAILQCVGLLGAETAPSTSGFIVIRNATKQRAFMTNATTLKAPFISAPHIPLGAAVDATPSIAASAAYSAAAYAGLFVKFGGRFSRKADSASLASAALTRAMNSWLSLLRASWSGSIEACLRSRLLASNAPPGFAASF